MTVTVSTSKVSYSGNGTTDAFSSGFRFLDEAHLLVTLVVDATGVETVKAITTDYTVTGAGDPTGTVTMLVPPATGETLIISRNVPVTQAVDYVANDPFPAETHEQALDKLTMINQQQDEVVNRSLVLPISVTGIDTNLPAPEALKHLAWNGAANAIVNVTGAEEATGAAFQTEVQTATAGQTVFTLTGITYTPGVGNIGIYINTGRQYPSAYTETSSTVVTFTGPLEAGDEVMFVTADVVTNTVSQASSVVYTPSGTGAVATNVQAELRNTAVVATVADMVTGSYDSGAYVTTKGYTTAGDGGFATYLVKTAAEFGGTPDEYGDHTLANTNVAVLQGERTYSRQFGVVADGVNDDTLALQACLDSKNASGGGLVTMPEGTVIISMASGNHPNACLLIPANTILRGASRTATTVTRLAGERATNGVLIVNKDYDTAAAYGAAGNIVLSDFNITDGTVGTSRSFGDLIALCHTDNVLIERVGSGVHDQHFADICGAKNITFRDCVNRQTNTVGSGSAIYQIDAPSALGVWGAFVDNTGCDNITIDNCDMDQQDGAPAIQLFHASSVTYSNINIINNRISAGYAANIDCIGIDSTSTSIVVRDLVISGNTVIPNHVDCRGINLFSNQSTNSFTNIKVNDNEVYEDCRSGMYIGSNASDTAGDLWLGVLCSGNTVKVRSNSAASVTPLAATFYGLGRAIVSDNLFRSTRDVVVDSSVVMIDSCSNIVFQNNTVGANFTSGSSTTATGLTVSNTLTAILTARALVKDNYISGSDLDYCLRTTSTAEADNILFSGNQFFGGTPAISHIDEQYAASDGTNGWHQVDLSSIGTPTKGAVAIAAGQNYTGIPLGLKKTGSDQPSPAKVTLQFSPNAITDFDIDTEALEFAYTSATTVAGTHLAAVNQTAGTMIIVTGVSGVSCTINNTTFQPAIRVIGYLKAYAGI